MKKRSLNILIILILFILLLGCDGEEKNPIINSCTKEFSTYEKTISKYKIRMEDTIDSVGCQIIPIYASIIKSDRIDLLDKLEENDKIVKEMLKTDIQFTQLIFNNSIFQEFFLNQKISNKFLENFNYLVKEKVKKRDRIKIKKDFNYINYLLLSAYYASTKEESILFYKRLKQNVSVDIIGSFGIVLSAINDTYSFEELIENFHKLSKELSKEEINNIAHRPQYFAYFLKPKKESFSKEKISLSELENIQHRVVFIYKTMFKKYQYENNMNQRDYALLTIENIYPYLLEINRSSNRDFEKLFKFLIKEDYLISLFNSGKCTQSTKDNFALFGNGNIESIIKLMNEQNHFFNELSSSLSEIDNGIMSLFYVANLYTNLNNKQWDIFKNLLNKLPYEKSVNIALIKKIETVGYFESITLQTDYNQIVESEYTPQSPNAPKYLNVLLTNYPRQTDVPLSDRVLYEKSFNQQLLRESLNDLISKNIDSLENHKFTKLERYLGNLDTLDNTLMVLSIVAAPFTGGASLSYVATKTALKIGAKKGAKYLAKKILNKGIRKVRIGRKRIDNQIGIKNKNLLGKKIESTEDTIGDTSLLFMEDTIQIKNICGEQR